MARVRPARVSAMTKPLHHPQALAPGATIDMIEEPSPGGVLSPAVLIERFEAKIAGGGVFLTLFGIGLRKEGAPLEHTPAITAFMSGRNAADLSRVLASAVAVLQAPAVDATKPQ
jgi:hypothetical protein